MGSAPLLSIVVPAFQAEETILGTLESIYSQLSDLDFDLEVLVVDDGSTDRGPEKVAVLGKQFGQLRLLRNSHNLGHGPSRNRGLEQSRGHYIVFVDADDRLLPGSLKAIGECCRISSSDVILIGVVETKSGRSRKITDSSTLNKLAREPEGWNATGHPELLMWPPATWSKIYRKDFLIRESIRFPEGYHQDIPWSVDVTLRATSISAIPRVCYEYIRRGQGTSTTRSKGIKTLARVDQVKLVRNRYSNSNLPPAVMTHLVALMAVHLIWGNRAAYRTIPGEAHEEYFHSCSRELREWWKLAQPGRSVKSEPLMPTSERIFFSRALLGDDWGAWQLALSRHSYFVRWKRRLDPRRHRLFPRR